MTIGVVFVIACGARTELEVGVIEDAKSPLVIRDHERA